MIGDVVGGADEIVEGKDQRAVPRMDDPRGDRKILVTVRLARPEVAGAAHCTTSSLALRALCARNAPYRGICRQNQCFRWLHGNATGALHGAGGEVSAGGFSVKSALTGRGSSALGRRPRKSSCDSPSGRRGPRNRPDR